MRTRWVFSVLALTLLLAISSLASTIVIGPFPDFAGWVEKSASVTLNTSVKFHIPWDGNISITDKITVRVTVRIPVFTPTYVRITTINVNQIVDPLSFFDIYAYDLDPLNPGTNLTGFNALDPELVPLSSETFIGVSGTEYSAPVQEAYLGDLPTMFPDFNLSAFANGDPGSIVYVAGPAEIPFADVPEPCTLGLLTLGAWAVMKRQTAFRIF